MKILHIIPSYLPATFASGLIKPTHYLNKFLVQKGVEVVVYTMNMDGNKRLDVPLEKKVDIDGVKVFYFPTTFLPWQYSYKLHRALAENVKNFDLIHITSVFLSVSTLGAYYAKKFKKSYIISPHGSLMKEPITMKSAFKKKIYINLIEKRNLANAAVIHFTVEAEKEEYLKAGFPLKKAIIIPNGFDVEDYGIRKEYEITKLQKSFKEKFGIAADRKIVLFLSRLNWKKGLDTLIPAFAEVVKKEPKAVLILVGPDDEGYKKNIQLLITNYQLQDKAIFTGMLLGKDKIEVLQDSDVFVLPSYSENFGMAVVEAMYFGLPVVITKGVGISREIGKASAGLVVEKDVKQVAEAILKILNNSELAKKISETGKKLVNEEFDSKKIAEKWIEEYNKIIKNV